MTGDRGWKPLLRFRYWHRRSGFQPR